MNLCYPRQPQLKIYITGLASILVLIWAGGMVYAITRYRLMVLSSTYAARDILSTMSDSLILIDPECKIVEVNNATLTLLNYTRDEVIGKPASILFTLEEILFIEKLLSKKEQLETLSSDGFITNHRMKYITKTKEEIPIDFFGSVMKEKNGDLVGLVCIVRDMREIIKSEKQKEKLDKLKNDFIANITHDFRSPLTAILNIADLALRFNKNIDNENKENYSVIYKASLRLKSSIDKLLELAKMDAHGIKLKIKKLELVSFIDKVLDFYSSSVMISGIKIKRKIPSKGIDDFYTDVEKLQEIIDNIISNAIKFVDPNSGIITCELEDKNDLVLISILDNGVGIPKDKLETIFNRFEQAHEGINSPYRGTGIGLAFSKQLVEYLKGKLWAESEGEGNGAKFFIELKKGIDIFDKKDFSNEEIKHLKQDDIKTLIELEIEKKLQEEKTVICFTDLNKENETDYKKGIILIIDDDRNVREIIMKYLKNYDYKNFIVASDGKQGLEAVYEYSPDLIICDYNMPNMKGDEFHNQVIKNPKFKEIPFIFLSAIIDDNLIIERREKGASAYLKKPIDQKMFIITVEEHIKRYFEYLKVCQLATIDELTGLNNRRAILASLKHELAIRKYRDLSIIFIDLDKFKEINDTYGHQTGDRILTTIGKIIKSSIRNYDIAGRYGGDEFIGILPETNLKQANYVAGVLRKTIINTKIENNDNQLSISASFGVTSLKDNSKYLEKTLNIQSIENIYEIKDISKVNWNKIEDNKIQISELLLKMVDMALYKAKQTICNKCGFATEKSYVFSNNICPKCKSDDLIIGRNKVVSFE